MKIIGVQQSYRNQNYPQKFIVEMSQNEMELIAGKTWTGEFVHPVELNIVDTVKHARGVLMQCAEAELIAAQLRSLADIVDGSTKALSELVKLPENDDGESTDVAGL